jgi:signal transduction histidine kinase
MSASASCTPDTRIARRLVAAADEARRQLERDLHDGAQQRLVLASLTLRRAAVEARGTPAEPLVAEAIDQLRQGLAELRDLARGIHPAALRERGLAPALAGLAARAPLPVELRVTAPRVDASVESAVYFTVAEALTNVARHAGARSATVAVELDGDALRAVVADDGAGGADLRAGSGLRGLADRVHALGGTLAVDSPPGGGTTLKAELPLAARRRAGVVARRPVE